MANVSDDDCLIIQRSPLEPAIGHLRKSLRHALKNGFTESPKSETFSSEEKTQSNSTEANEDLGIVDFNTTVFIMN